MPSLSEVFKRTAKTIADHERTPPQIVGFTPILTSTDDDDDGEAPRYDKKADAIGAITNDSGSITFAIEYENANGDFNRRRISAKSITLYDDDKVVIHAYCYERRALRNFRLDRITAIIDLNGAISEVDTDAFEQMVDAILTTLPEATRKSPKTKPAGFKRIINILRPPVRILCALAICDDHLHPEEVEAILQWIDWEAIRRDIHLDPADVAELKVYITACRPTLDDLETSARQMLDGSSQTLQALKRGIRSVIEADGELKIEETDLAAEIQLLQNKLSDMRWEQRQQNGAI